jgi:hypothetical protein
LSTLKSAFGLGLSVLVLAGAFSGTAQAAECERPCLIGLLTQYLDALAAHKPELLPVAAKVRFTEDSKDLKLGEGFWKTVTKVGGYRQDFIDIRQQVAATHVMTEEGANPVMLAVVLHVADRKIAGIETLVVHNREEGRLFAPENLKTPREGMSRMPEKSQLNPREEMIRLAMYYPRGLTIGSFSEIDTPFTKEAYRFENGVGAAGPGCGRPNKDGQCDDIKTQRISKHPALTSSVTAVDEEQGKVLLWMNFGETGQYGAGNALVTFEAFKVYGGQLHAVEAFVKVLPASTVRRWN